ncbi:DtxR family transcriptional regulator [Actinomycetota bacterium]|nr:DtxR family transcriptional regulator [Actinomycetota bacterium]
MSQPETSALTAVAQDYLKVIWSAREWSSAPVTTKMLAERIGVGASTVSETVRRLADQGLVVHAPYSSIELTALGTAHAVQIVRRHRLIETFLVSELGYAWDEVHDEAEVLEHAVSDLMIDRIDRRLGHPTRDPHGDPIPTPDGVAATPAAWMLWDMDGGHGQVARISDADPDLLRYLASVGFVLDARIEVVERRDFSGVIAVRVRPPAGAGPADADDAPGTGHPVDLGEVAARAIWLLPDGEPD